jgi:hypothetical protein
MMAFLASHMHTALVLFNQTGTFWTRFAISFQPRDIFWITAFFFLPDFDLITCWWQVILVFTIETEGITAFTFGRLPLNKVRLLNNVIASFLRTPFHILVLICHLFTMPCFVFSQIIYSIFLIWLIFQVF